jgi:hypothetical protein
MGFFYEWVRGVMDGGSCTIADTEVAEFFAILDREGAFF